ncbi:MAG: cation:proton antiporter [Myxococcales bacterium]|nr:cation:proton antiporter [Myxococcales bacterium]
MILALAVAAGAIVFAGVYLILSRDLLRMVVGVSILGYAANLALLASGRPEPGMKPAIVPEGLEALSSAAADPVPQALVLTSIVIGFALTCFSLVLVLAIQQRTGGADADALREVEPPPTHDHQPALVEEEP